MKKETISIIIISILLIASVSYLFVLYNKNTKLNQEYNLLNEEKNKAVNDMEQCKSDLDKKNSEYDLLLEDAKTSEKTCMTDNACKGRFSGISWKCNNVGDLADENSASHICICSADCVLSATEIKNS
jgi:hypothetical protein